MNKTLKTIWNILKESLMDFIDNKSLRMSAALSYYTVFSLPPMLIVIISMCEIFYGKAAIEGSIYGHINEYVGNAAAKQIELIIFKATLSKHITWVSVSGFASLLLAATGIFSEIQVSINEIWRLKAKPKKGWLKIIVNWTLSFSIVVSLSLIVLISLVINSIMDIIGYHLLKFIPVLLLNLALGINLFLTFFTTTLLFAVIFKVLPDARIRWRDVIVGSITTSFLFMSGKSALNYYLNSSNITSSYGAAGSLIVILLWVYYSAAILYFGATFTRVYARFKGSDIYPNDYAVWIKEIELKNKDSIQASK